MSKINIFPFCMQCRAIPARAESFWLRQDQTFVNTVSKLYSCSRCHIARYCSEKCRKRNWKAHEAVCRASGEQIKSRQIDTIVKYACKNQEGGVRISLNLRCEVVSMESIDIRLVEGDLAVNIEFGETSRKGPYQYLRCSKASWKAASEAVLHPPKGATYSPGIVQVLGEKMVRQGKYREAFEMMARLEGPGQKLHQDVFFERAVSLMHENGLTVEEIASYTKRLGKNRFKVQALILSPGDVQVLGEKMVRQGKYREAFRMMVRLKGPGQKFRQDVFFRKAVPLMHENGLTVGEIASYTKRLGKNRFKVQALLFPAS